jgi:hypothetical protein
VRERDTGTEGTLHPFRRTVEETVIISTIHKGRFEAGEEETTIMPAVLEEEVIPGDHTQSYPEKAIGIVARYILAGYPPNPDFKDGLHPYVVWFSKTLQNWKALVGVPLLDGRYYEVTYNGDKRETYLDVYQKVENLVIRDEDL